MGLMTGFPTWQPIIGDIFVSADGAGQTDDGLDFGSEDILKWDGTQWSLFFDGSAAGLEPHRAKHNVNAFWIEDEATGSVILSFTQNSRRVPDIEGKVDGMDLVRWDGTEFSLYFDGSDVGLTVKTQEKIDGLHVLPGSDSPINGGNCEAYLLISTHGPGKVPEFGGGVIRFGGEDVLGFCATELGEDTEGFWHVVLDGSEEDMPRNSTDSISLSADGNTLYLTTRDDFEVDDAEGDDSEVYTYDFTTGEFAGPIFRAPDNGLHETVDGLQVEG